jgi:hypothetical protein
MTIQASVLLGLIYWFSSTIWICQSADYVSLYIPDDGDSSPQKDLSYEFFKYQDNFHDYEHTMTIFYGSGPVYVVQLLDTNKMGNLSLLIESSSGRGGNFSFSNGPSVLFDAFSYNNASWRYSIQVNMYFTNTALGFSANITSIELEPKGIPSSNSRLSSAAIAWIVVGVVMIVALLCGSALFMKYQQRKRLVNDEAHSEVFEEQELPKKKSVGEDDNVECRVGGEGVPEAAKEGEE